MCLSRIGIVGDKQTSVLAIAAAAAAAAVLHIGYIAIEDKVGDSGDHVAAITKASRSSLQKGGELSTRSEGSGSTRSNFDQASHYYLGQDF